MKVETLIQWFTNELLPSLVKDGTFSKNQGSQTLQKCEFEAIEKYVNNFSSTPSFAKLLIKTSSGIISRGILVKFQSQDPLFREKMRTVSQFSNEVTLYNEIYPNFVEFLQSCNLNPNFMEQIVPKCYFASKGNGDLEKAVLILEDLRDQGFKLADSLSDLDLKHCLVSVEKLARFHAVSLAMKFSGWKAFEKLKTSFVEIWLEDVPMCREQCEDFQGYVCLRGIDYLMAQKDCEVPKEYLENLRTTLTPIFELLRSLHTPKEPLSVLCHGDFNRNNILFKYLNGEPIDAKLIDYQMVFYGSPSMDLGFLIYMNTTLEFREKHFDHIFEHYYSNLVKCVSTILKKDEKLIADRIPLEAFKEDFGRVAIWHYVIVSFFLPYMMTAPDGDFETDLKYKNNKEMAEKNFKMGGDVVSKRISEIIIDFYKRKFYM